MRSFIAKYLGDNESDSNNLLTFMYLYLRCSATSPPSNKESKGGMRAEIAAEKILSCIGDKDAEESIPEFMAMIFVLELMNRLLAFAQDPQLPIYDCDIDLLNSMQNLISNCSPKEVTGGQGTLSFIFTLVF